MIYSQITTGNQMDLSRWSCTTSAQVITLPPSPLVRDFCLCTYECPYSELAFVNLSDINNSYENDYRKFLLELKDSSSTYSFTLTKNGIDYDFTNLYGEVYALGFNNDRPLYTGINVIWWKVVNQLGYGTYTITTSQTDFGEEKINKTHEFIVTPFNANRANGTVKIEVQNKGVTMNGNDFTGLGTFNNMIRINGKIELTDPEITRESLEDSDRVLIPIQNQIIDQYIINIEHIPPEIGYKLIHEDSLMNWIVTDYNLFNEDIRDINVITNSSTVTNTAGYTKKSYEVTARASISKLNRPFV